MSATSLTMAGPMGKRRHHAPEDLDAFREAVADVRPLRHDRAQPAMPRPPPVPLQTLADERQVLADLLGNGPDPAQLETGEELSYRRPDVAHELLRRLQRGHYATGPWLDLHGLTVPEARLALADFIRAARQAGNCCVRVVHGKGKGSLLGQPVLKRKVSHGLRQRDDVLAFCSARGVDGGTGAVYVLLKR
jgi:DNA-nicking Smr family endonuclease